MPVAPMNENNRMKFRERKVRLSRQVLVSEPVPEPKSVQTGTENPFGLRIPAAHLGHCDGPLFCRENVSHVPLRSEPVLISDESMQQETPGS